MKRVTIWKNVAVVFGVFYGFIFILTNYYKIACFVLIAFYLFSVFPVALVHIHRYI